MENNIILNKNIKAISIKSPETSKFLETFSVSENIELEKNKNNEFFVKRNSISLHSLYDPRKESKRNIDSFLDKNNNLSTYDSVFILGAGLFYHVEEFLERKLKNNIETIVLEADQNLLLTILKNKDLSNILTKITLLVPEAISSFLEGDKKVVNHIVYRHNPSIRFNPKVYQIFEQNILFPTSDTIVNEDRFRTYKKENSNFSSLFDNTKDIKLKIALVGPIYGGSLPIFYYINDILEKLGHTVILVDYSEFKGSMDSLDSFSKNPVYRNKILNNYTQLLAEGIVIKAVENKVDLVLGVAQAPFTVSTLNQLKSHNISTAFWFVEDFRTLNYWKLLAPHFDYFFTIQKNDFLKELDKICNNTTNHNYFLPTAAKLDTHISNDNISIEDKKFYGSAVSFVGAGYYNRRRVFPSLLGYDFKIWGNDWNLNSPLKKVIQKNGERVTTEESIKIFNSTTININLHSSSYIDGVNLDGDFLNPRTFELAASKNFQLVDARTPIFDFFEKDEIATFTTQEDLLEKIDYYLANEDERNKIIEKSYNRVIKNHSYELRVKEMLHIIISKNSNFKSYKSKKISKESLLQNISSKEHTTGKDYSNLKEIINSVKDNDVNLNTIVNSILEKDKKLNKEESLFLMMNEFYNLAKRKKLV